MYKICRYDPTFEQTLKRYFGKPGYYIGVFVPLSFMTGVLIVYYVIMTQLLYAIMLSIIAWTTSIRPVMLLAPTWSTFSSAYSALCILPIVNLLCSARDIGFLTRLQGSGAIFIIALLGLMIGTGIFSLTNTNFELGSQAAAVSTNW
jgi:hypothetical protein